MKHEAIAAARTLIQRALAGHAAIGLLAGALIYIIALTGTLIVIHERWQRWEQPDIAEMARIAPAAVQRAIEAVLASEAGKPKTTHLYVHMPTASLPRTVVTTDHGAVYVDASGRIVAPEAHAWTEFLTGLHIYLHLPQTLGLIVVGALGVMLAALVITGVAAHPRIFRDAFRLRARGPRQLAQADWHNRLGVWTLPFALALALTGAFIGLAGVGTALIANSHHGGNLERAYAPIFGHEPAPDTRAAPIANVAAALRVMGDRFSGPQPSYVIIHDPATVGQRVQILATHDRRLIYGENYMFDPAGRFAGRTGLSDGHIGQQVAASTYGLHFGSYGGLPVELAYMALGLALCVISATGMSLWLQKRRRRGAASPRLEAFWATIVWGVPIILAAMLWVRAGLGAEAPLALLFWVALAAAAASAIMWPKRLRPAFLRRALGVMLLLTALTHAVSLPSLNVGLLAQDLALALTGGLLSIADRRRLSRS